jgi:hypothetical protein
MEYQQDGLNTVHNHDFMQDKDFCSAYARGVKATGMDYMWHWRVHIGLWAAKTVVNRPGDFVECGVNAGFMSSSIMHALNWDSLNKTFYLLDTFSGLSADQVSKQELEDGILEENIRLIANKFYVTSSAQVRENFSEWKNVNIIEGSIPETLNEINSSQISFLHIDLNCAPPEVAAIRYLWPKLVPGAVVLLDDYAYKGYHHQKIAMDSFAQDCGIEIASLPTGQGLIFK